MRVGVIAYGLDRPFSGISRYTAELVEKLADFEPQVETVLLSASKQLPDECQRLRRVALPGCRLAPGLVTLGNMSTLFVSHQQQLNVIHDPTGITPFLFGGGRARSVVTVHDVFAWSCPGHSSTLDTLIYRYWLPRVLPGVDAVITDSQASRDDIVQFLGVPRSRIRVVHLAVDGRYRPVAGERAAAVLKKHRLPDGYILYVGSVEKRKNLLRLLEAYARLRDRGESRPLAIAGIRRLNNINVLAALQELDLERSVVFTGYVADEDLPALYSGADLFVFPSLYEGFGLPPLEAMACGTPVVCSNAASLPEVVGDAAVMVAPYDVEGLAEAMRLVLADKDLRQELRERGLERARQFTWERTARETVAVYREVCG